MEFLESIRFQTSILINFQSQSSSLSKAPVFLYNLSTPALLLVGTTIRFDCNNCVLNQTVISYCGTNSSSWIFHALGGNPDFLNVGAPLWSFAPTLNFSKVKASKDPNSERQVSTATTA